MAYTIPLYTYTKSYLLLIIMIHKLLMLCKSIITLLLCQNAVGI